MLLSTTPTFDMVNLYEGGLAAFFSPYIRVYPVRDTAMRKLWDFAILAQNNNSGVP